MATSVDVRSPASANGQSQASDGANGSGVMEHRLQVDRVFCPEGVSNPFDTTEWELRTAVIQDDTGSKLFEQTDCEIPKAWSQLATNVVVSKYFYGEVNTPERETSVRQLIHRVTRSIADWGMADGYFASRDDAENFYRDLTWLCLHQHGAFNSPVWFNVGLFQRYGVKGDQCNWHWNQETGQVEQPKNPYEFPQASACFIQSVDDNMESIMDLARSEAMLFKFGSGTGTDLSTIRSHREKLSGGGKPSGPLSFMRVYDQIAAVVKSGGKTRRAAKMQSLKVWHPDIMEFIECKAKEERKARILIKKGGYEANFNGEAYSSILFQNANLSVRVTDDFMQAVEDDRSWKTRFVRSKTDGPTYQAKNVLHKMAECAWYCGDPGVQYDTTINKWHTCPNSGRINASNPCSEYMFLDDTACNLASINLMKFREPDGTFDVERFTAACRLFFIAQEILVDHASYPTAQIAENSHLYRPLGLGYSNLGSLIMSAGVPYDSEAAYGLCGAMTALLHGAANLASAELSRAVGPFDGYANNREPMLNVMQMHRDAVEEIDDACPEYLKNAARRVWNDVLDNGRQHGFRNAQATVLAPTGTISFLMDCDTTGIEPDIALVKYKSLAGGGMLKIVNRTVHMGLRTLGYDEPTINRIVEHVDEQDTIEGSPDIKDEHLPVFDCAFKPRNGERSIAWKAHVRMMGAAQPFLSGAISKTVNMPRESTAEDIADAYFEGWKLGLKALAIYRDGSKESQPLSTGADGEAAAEGEGQVGPRRERLPDTRNSVTHKFDVAGHEGYLTVGLYDDGRPGELFITMAKEGSTIGGLMDAFGTAISMSLQYGVPLDVLVNKFSFTRFEPMGLTKNPDVRIAKILVDYLFRWMGVTFIPGYREAHSNANDVEAQPANEGTDGNAAVTSADTRESQQAQDVTANESQSEVDFDAQMARSHKLTVDTLEKSFKANAERRNKLFGAEESSSEQAAEAPRQTGGPIKRRGGRLNRHNQQFASFQVDAPTCDMCGNITVRNGNCYLCHVCGNSMGCS